MSAKRKFPGKQGEFTYSCPVREEYGTYPMVVNGHKYIALCVSMDAEDLYFDPNNPRLWGEDGNYNFSNAGQNRIQEALTSGKFEDDSERLGKCLDVNGGQSQALWAQCLPGPGGKLVPTLFDGNRRLSVAKWEQVLTLLFPDQMTKEDREDLMAQPHVAGLLNWLSTVRSEVGWKYLTERKMLIQEITDRLQFKSSKEAKKFIHAYKWWKLSGLPKAQWSKFHHLYVPQMVDHFGYDENHWVDDSEPFKAELRKPMGKDNSVTPQDVDEVVREAAIQAGNHVPKNFKSDFYWAIKLINDHCVTDCRHCDGIVKPALRAATESYGFEVLKMLQSKPKTKHSPDMDRDDGQGGLDPDTPAQMAWNYLKECRTQNHLSNKSDRLIGDLRATMKQNRRMEPYLDPDNTDNILLRGQLTTLIGVATQFLQRMGSGSHMTVPVVRTAGDVVLPAATKTQQSKVTV